MRLLLVEDSERLRLALVPALTHAGFAVDAAVDGAEALGFLSGFDYQLIVLDLMLPKLDGFSVLAELRDRGLRPRVLVLSARDQVADRIRALDLGADDYLVKPFDLDELLARLNALSRRSLEQTQPVLEVGGLVLDSRRRAVQFAGQALSLTPKEFALLECLMREPDRVYTRGQLFERVYSGSSESSDKVIEVLMSVLRGKLSRAGVPELIETRRGFGYLMRMPAP
jgi:DNA-binding response OmpR family regulator